MGKTKRDFKITPLVHIANSLNRRTQGLIGTYRVYKTLQTITGRYMYIYLTNTNLNTLQLLV